MVVPFSVLADGILNGDNHLELLLALSAPHTLILAVTLSVTEAFDGPGADLLERSVGYIHDGVTAESAILPATSFGDFVPDNFAIGQTFVFLTKSAQIKLFLNLPDATEIEDYEALTAGAMDIWLLISSLP